jgi:hypothetical protein
MADWNVFWEWEEMKSAEQWCFSIVRINAAWWCFSISETVLFQHRGNQQCCTAVFQHRESLSSLKNRPLLCFDPAKIDCRTIFLDRDY